MVSVLLSRSDLDGVHTYTCVDDRLVGLFACVGAYKRSMHKLVERATGAQRLRDSAGAEAGDRATKSGTWRVDAGRYRTDPWERRRSK